MKNQDPVEVKMPEDTPGSFPLTGNEPAAKLPLPIRSTRYAIGGALIAIIITVVTTTYLRIEGQLERTLKGTITSVLSENRHQVSHWLRDREILTQKAAKLPALVGATRSLLQRGPDQNNTRELLKTLTPIIETGLASSALIVNKNGEYIFNSGNAPPRVFLDEKLGPARLAGSGFFIRAGHFRRFVSLAPIDAGGKTNAYLVLTIDAQSLIEGLETSRPHAGGESYAYDERGIFGKVPNSAKNGKHTRHLTFGEQTKSQSSGPGDIREYLSHSGDKVIGSSFWIEKYRVGVAAEIPFSEANRNTALLRQSFLVLVTLVGASVLGFLALGRWTLRVREESLLMTRRLSRLARAIQPLSAALENDPSAVVLGDSEGVVVYANASCQRVLHFDAHILGRKTEEIFANLHGDLQAALISGQDSIVAQGTDSKEDTLLISSRSLNIDGAPHYLYMLRPITQQVRRQEVEHWKKLIRVLSHELNNTLAPITSLLSSARTVIKMSNQDPRLGDILESIAERTRHLVSFLEGYREVARLPRPAPRDTDWHTLMDSLAAQVSFQQVGILPDLPGYFDPHQLERVLLNVLRNAQEAGSDPADIELDVVQLVEGFSINIQDRGSGMPEAVLKQAMLPFFSTKRTGTGVGLALSREIIEAHGGQLSLANREGGGLTVSCYLPMAVQPPISRRAKNQQQGKNAGESQST